MKEFRKYEKEIWEKLEELHDFSDDKIYAKKLIKQIKNLLERVLSINVDGALSEDLDEMTSFVDYVNDVLKEYENKLEEEPEL